MKPGVFLLGLAAVTGQLVPGKDPSAPFISVAGVALPGPTEKSAILPGIMHGSVQIGQYHPGIPAFYPVNYKPHYQSGEFLAHCSAGLVPLEVSARLCLVALHCCSFSRRVTCHFVCSR